MDKKRNVRKIFLKLEKNVDFKFYGDDKLLEKKISSPKIEYLSSILLNNFKDFPINSVIFSDRESFVYFSNKSKKEKEKILEKIEKKNVSLFLIEKYPGLDTEIIKKLNNLKIPVFVINENKNRIIYSGIKVLEDIAGEKTKISGVLVEVFEQGILIIGESGIGKSECALELIRRNHRLVADDIVKIKRIGSKLIGSSPSLANNYLEIRGLGIIDIKDFFGLRAVADEVNLNLVVNLVVFNKKKHFTRIGVDKESYRILGINLPMYTIPMSPGKDISTVVEVISKNEYANEKGINTPMKITKNLIEKIRNRIKENEKK